MKQNKIYLLFTNTRTLFTRTIRLYTKADYNHASIALDPNFNETYSFGRKKASQPLPWWICQRKKINENLFRTADCIIYSYTITKQQERRIKQVLANFDRNKETYHYNLIGLFGVMLNKPIQRKKCLFLFSVCRVYFKRVWDYYI